MSNSWSLIVNFIIWISFGLILLTSGLLQQESHFTVLCLIHFDSLVNIMLLETLDCVFFLWTVLILLLQAVYLCRLRLWDGQQLNSLFNDLSLPYVAPGDFPVHAYVEGLSGVWMEFMCRFWSSPLFVSLFSENFIFWTFKPVRFFRILKIENCSQSERVFNCSPQESS